MGERMADRAVTFENVSFSYDGVAVLKDVHLSIPAGEFTAVVGPNGGGKTTLLRLILGLLVPDRGLLHVFGRPPPAVRSRIGYVPQHFQFDPKFPVTVMDVILMGRLRPGWRCGPYRRADRDAGAVALREVGLDDMAGRSFAALSGGERQRVLIARALATDPDLVLLDEPLAHVDAGIVDDLYQLFEGLSHGRTVVMISHDVGFVSRLVRQVVCVNRTVVTHPTSELTGRAISELYGTDVNVVRHDVHLRRQRKA